MNYKHILVTAFGLFAVQLSWAQSSTKDDVRFFEHLINDAATVSHAYAGGEAGYADFDDGSGFFFNALGGMPVSDQLDVGASWAFVNTDPKKGKSQSGRSDPILWGRYRISSTSRANITVGGVSTLPVGEEKVGADNFDFGAFMAARMPLKNGVVVMGSVGLNSVEVIEYGMGINSQGGFGDPSGAVTFKTAKKERKLTMHLGGGAIFALDPKTHLIGEVGIDTEEDYFALTGGADHALSANSRLRAALVVGLDDGAPDFALRGGFLVDF